MWGTLDDREREARKAVLNLILGGRLPEPEAIAEVLGCPASAAKALVDALSAKGFVVREGSAGAIVAAYPLSVRATPHRVRLQTGQTAYALCAMDALGVSPLFDAGAAIESRCPHCELPIHLEVQEGEIRRQEPATAVLWYGLADLLENPVEGLDLSADH